MIFYECVQQLKKRIQVTEPSKGQRRILILASVALMSITPIFLTRKIASNKFLATLCLAKQCSPTSRCKGNLISRPHLERFPCAKVCKLTSSHFSRSYKTQVPSQAYSPHSNLYRTIPDPALSLQALHPSAK